MSEYLPIQDQSPEILFITCCDARILPERVAGAEPGTLFIARNVANIVPPFGTGQMGMGAVVEYAMRHLHVARAVICGHTDCGGIEALDAAPDWGREVHLARWIDYARPARTRVEASGISPEERHLATVRENVLLQLENLRSYDPIREAERAGKLQLEGWVYYVETGGVEAHDPQAGTWSPLRAELAPEP